MLIYDNISFLSFLSFSLFLIRTFLYLWLRQPWIWRWTRRRRQIDLCAFDPAWNPLGSRIQPRLTKPRDACCLRRILRSFAARCRRRSSSRCYSKALATAADRSSRLTALRFTRPNTRTWSNTLTTFVHSLTRTATDSRRAFFFSHSRFLLR